MPGEGKSTIAVNLANLFAAGGRSTLLIDGDMRNPQLSRLLSPDAKSGLVELIAGKIAFTKVDARHTAKHTSLYSDSLAAANRKHGRLTCFGPNADCTW